MRNISSQHSKAIFTQLGGVSGNGGVKAVIENHDAWLHSDAIMVHLTAAVRMELARRARSTTVAARIDAQRHALSPLVTRLPRSLAHSA